MRIDSGDRTSRPGMQPRAAIITLGCKLNQYESQQIREILEQAGYRIVHWDEPADVYVVNSCTVTSQADRETRRLARGAKRRQPDAVVVVAGCYVETGASVLQELPEIDLLVNNAQKPHLPMLLADFAPGRFPRPSGPPPHEPPLVRYFAGHTRAFVKVQEGCDAACAFCIIPRARGPSRSIPAERVIEQARLLAAAGYSEIVLIGTHLGRYGLDLAPPMTLAELCRRLLPIPQLARLRLSSIEPREVTDELVAMLAEAAKARQAGCFDGPAKLCRHLHIPLQSGCDSVLRRMNRPYDTAFYKALIERLVTEVPGVCIGADVLVGFPGETDKEFEETAAFVSALPLSYLHVFTYSARPGTPAAEMPDQVRPDIRKRRNHALRQVSSRKYRQFMAGQVGQVLDVLIERRTGDGAVEGLSDNYLRVQLTDCQAPAGSIVLVEITSADGAVLSGKLVSTSAQLLRSASTAFQQSRAD
ncbi:MAG: tRNA (N(6)-L-threonylcarbamoyladenosine(37)-C(2))-methylthiotransferase MtaB [Armatimonadetes bacterium]|nr:tRNA (N(6)-L-threonylcarbamoyladenosine(37)-C(2))-methylthiotransferase MtaB [Armatimonadota bacterium]